MKWTINNNKATTLVELMISALILSIIFGTTSLLFASVMSFWSIEDARTDLQQKANWTLQKMSSELQESGFNSSGQIQASMLDNTGTNSSDVLRFAVPICLCGISVIDSNGDVRNWGAPSTWGQSGCFVSWTLNAQGKVDICHVPSGNPNNTQSLSVNQSAVNAHLAHGDWIGDCNSCDPTSYTNRMIEYSLDASARLVRKVLNQNSSTVSQSVMMDEVQGFQTSVNSTDGQVTLTVTLSRSLPRGRTISSTGSLTVVLRNRGGS